MKFRSILMLLISFVLAIAAALTANTWIKNRTGGTDDAMSAVVVAAADIPFGTKIDVAQIKTVLLPSKLVPAKAFRDPQAVIGRVTNTNLYQDEILIEGRIVEHLGGSALAAVVEEGRRAITVGVNEVVGVAGFLLPGNRVDLISTRNSGRGTNSRTLLENLKVLAVDQTISPDNQKPVVVRAITLEVDPAQAEEIAQATEEGKVRFTLRNPLDGNRNAPKLEEPKPGALALDTPSPAKPQPPSQLQTVVLETVVVIRGLVADRESTGADLVKKP